MKEDLIKKLYCMSFLLKEAPALKILKITETFQQAMDFKKVLVYQKVPEGFSGVASSPSPCLDYSRLYEIKNSLCFDLTSPAGIQVGKLCLVPKRTGRLSKSEKELLSAFAAQSGHLLEAMSQQDHNREHCLEQEIDRYKFLLNKDRLTGLFNRYYFEENLNSLERQGTYPVSIIMIDVDNLKIINDTMGHRYGDDTLKTAAELLKNTFRKDDIVARIGGDEFAVLLPGTRENIARRKCRLLAENLKKHNWVNTCLKLHFSHGSATSETVAEPLRKVMEKADLKMYEQKRKNKHRLINDFLPAGFPREHYSA